VLRLEGRGGDDEATCPHCQGVLDPLGFYSFDRLSLAAAAQAAADQTLDRIGLDLGDVLTVTTADGSSRHYELTRRT
jgi:hypothetical protein